MYCEIWVIQIAYIKLDTWRRVQRAYFEVLLKDDGSEAKAQREDSSNKTNLWICFIGFFQEILYTIIT